MGKRSPALKPVPVVVMPASNIYHDVVFVPRSRRLVRQSGSDRQHRSLAKKPVGSPGGDDGCRQEGSGAWKHASVIEPESGDATMRSTDARSHAGEACAGAVGSPHGRRSGEQGGGDSTAPLHREDAIMARDLGADRSAGTRRPARAAGRHVGGHGGRCPHRPDLCRLARPQGLRLGADRLRRRHRCSPLAAIVYRYTLWITRPPTWRYFRAGWVNFLSWRNFRRYTLLIPRAWWTDIFAQTFILKRGFKRWLTTWRSSGAWCSPARSRSRSPSAGSASPTSDPADYQFWFFGVPMFTFPIEAAIGLALFHALDFTAVLLIAGLRGRLLAARHRCRAAA